MADTPIELLGLAALHEYHHPHANEPYWWRVSDGGLLDHLEDEALERSFWDLHDRNPSLWASKVRDEISEWRRDPSVSLADRLGIRESSAARVLEEFASESVEG